MRDLMGDADQFVLQICPDHVVEMIVSERPCRFPDGLQDCGALSGAEDGPPRPCSVESSGRPPIRTASRGFRFVWSPCRARESSAPVAPRGRRLGPPPHLRGPAIPRTAPYHAQTGSRPNCQTPRPTQTESSWRNRACGHRQQTGLVGSLSPITTSSRTRSSAVAPPPISGWNALYADKVYVVGDWDSAWYSAAICIGWIAAPQPCCMSISGAAMPRSSWNSCGWATK
jgi:hypothetical protein